MVFEEFFQSTGLTITLALEKLAQSFIETLPILVGAIIIILFGYLVGKLVEHIIIKLMKKTSIDEWVDEQNLTGAVGGKKISSIIGAFAKWYIIAIFLAQAVNSFNLKVLENFLSTIAFYIPQILLALVIVISGLLIGRYVKNAVEATTYNYRKTFGFALEILIVYMAMVMGLDTIEGISVTILLDAFRIAFTAAALTIAIIVGISFGFAFKDDAKKALKEMKK